MYGVFSNRVGFTFKFWEETEGADRQLKGMILVLGTQCFIRQSMALEGSVVAVCGIT